MSIARQMAEQVFTTTDIPGSTRNMVLHTILDLTTAAIAGSSTTGARHSKAAAMASWGNGDASCWFSNERLPTAGAAFVNSTMASILDLDDGHRAAAGHPGAAIIPAVFADADVNRYDTNKLGTAIALGYEVAVRSSAARNLKELDTLVSGRWVAQGVAAAVGWLRGLDPAQITQAIAISAVHAPNLNAVAYSNEMGNHVKEGIPWATACGITAVDLAEAGFTGPTDCFDNPHLFDRNVLLLDFGKTWAIEGVYFKPYSCCRWAHAGMDALLALKSSCDIHVDQIESIEVRTFSRALQLNNDIAPTNMEAAQYSIPFCMAVAAVEGPAALLPLEKSSLNNRQVLELSDKISLSVDPDLDAMFSNAVPAEIDVTANDRKFSRRIISPRGEPSNPMDWDDLVEKLNFTTAGLVTADMSVRIQHAISEFFSSDDTRLLGLLSEPLPGNHNGLVA